MATLIGFIYENNYTQLLLKDKTQVFDVRRWQSWHGWFVQCCQSFDLQILIALLVSSNSFLNRLIFNICFTIVVLLFSYILWEFRLNDGHH